jgi:hypothetical protein
MISFSFQLSESMEAVAYPFKVSKIISGRPAMNSTVGNLDPICLRSKAL